MPTTDELQQQINVLKARMLQVEIDIAAIKTIAQAIKADILADRAKARDDEVLADKKRWTIRRRMKK